MVTNTIYQEDEILKREILDFQKGVELLCLRDEKFSRLAKKTIRNINPFDFIRENFSYKDDSVNR